MEGMVEGKTEVLMEKKLIFDHSAIFCMSLYAPSMWPQQSPLCDSLSGTSQSSGWPQSQQQQQICILWLTVSSKRVKNCLGVSLLHMWKSLSVGYHEAALYFVLLIRESPEVTNVFRPKLLPAAIQSCGLQLAHSLVYIYYAVSYTIQLPAFSDTNKGVSSASKIMWKVQLLNTVTFLGRSSTWIFRWAKPRSCRYLGALPRTRRILDARFSNFRYSFHTCMFSLTTAPLTDGHFCVYLRAIHTRPFPACRRTGHDLHTKCSHLMDHWP